MANEQLLAAMACNRDVSNEKPSAKQDCSNVVNISVFFDGTGNNRFKDEKDLKWSNVARLWQSADIQTFAPDGTRLPNYPIYISGVGTPYNDTAANWVDSVQIMFEDAPVLGGSSGAGGNRRIAKGQRNVNDTLRSVLIANAKQLGGVAQAYADKSTGDSFDEVEKALAPHRLIKIINLSIFGFSRGAALARAFSNDLLKKCHTDKDGILRYGTYAMRINFMGLFDTVASFGVPGGNVDLPWDERNLVVPTCVERCVHLVSAHEVRFSFPVDLIRRQGKLQCGWREEAYPGVHSDVGGGYAPADQGSLYAQGLTNNYARIPMREMMSEAVTHGVRMLSYSDVETINAPLFDERFAVLPKTEGDFKRYMAEVGAGNSIEESIAAHMKALYSGYGTMARNCRITPYQRQAHGNIKSLLHASMEEEVARYREAIKASGNEGNEGNEAPRTFFMNETQRYAQAVQPEAWRLEAWEIEASDAVRLFIEGYVHDSKVDFLGNIEPFSYFRPRGMAESQRNVLAVGMQWLGELFNDAPNAKNSGI